MERFQFYEQAIPEKPIPRFAQLFPPPRCIIQAVIFIIIADIMAGIHTASTTPLKEMELHGREGRRGTDRRSVGLKKSERRRARTRVRIDRRLIYGGQWIGPLFTPVVATSPVRFFLFLVPTTIPCYDSLSPIVTFHGAYGKPLDRGRDCLQLLSIYASTRWFRLRSLPIFFRLKKEETIIVPSLLFSPPFLLPSRFLSKKRRNTDTKVIASSFEAIDRGNNESSMRLVVSFFIGN